MVITSDYLKRKGCSMNLKLSKGDAAKLRAAATLAGVSVGDFVSHMLRDAMSRMLVPAVESCRDREVVLDFVNPAHVIATLKAIRTATGMGLKDAKDIVDKVRWDGMPTAIKVPGAKYLAFVNDLKACGAKFRIL